ncbi:MAG: hypothetical protein IKT57_01315 [Clostridia bacterium]|nr:hypothetical protein [Clostridia bacterium]
MRKHTLLKLFLGLLMLVLVLFAGSSALAEKHWVDMTIGDANVGSWGLESTSIDYDHTLTGYGEGETYVFNVEGKNLVYSTKVEPQEDVCWYTVEVYNNGISMEGWNLSGGLTMYLANSDGQWIIENRGLDRGKTTSVSVRLEPGEPFYLVFIAYNNSTGVVSFEILPEKDPHGESMDAATETAAGDFAQQTIAISSDKDWYKIPARSAAFPIAMQLENRIDDNLVLELYDEFKEMLISRPCPYGETTQVAYTCEATVDYYVRISTQNGRNTGRYFYGWCDGSHHILTEFQTLWPATCTEEGLQGRVCTMCSEVIGATPIAMLPHNPGEMATLQNATCTTDGLRGQQCTMCAMLLQSETIPAAGHNAGEMVVALAAACTADGLKEQRCTNCGELLASETVPAHGHTADVPQTEIAPTCTLPGVNRQRCIYCDIVLHEDTLPATGHVNGAAIIEMLPTCTEMGIQRQYCEICKQMTAESIIPATGHKAGVDTPMIVPTCTEEGLDHVYCITCGYLIREKNVAALGHNYTEWTETSEPTMRQEGTEECTCLQCSDLQTRSVPKLTLWEAIFGRK